MHWLGLWVSGTGLACDGTVQGSRGLRVSRLAELAAVGNSVPLACDIRLLASKEARVVGVSTSGNLGTESG